MGFSAIPPRLDSTVISAINNWVPHADAAIGYLHSPTRFGRTISALPPKQISSGSWRQIPCIRRS
jgi:hypothetical protein